MRTLTALVLLLLPVLLCGCSMFASSGAAGRRDNYVEVFEISSDGKTRLGTEPTESDTDRTDDATTEPDATDTPR